MKRILSVLMMLALPTIALAQSPVAVGSVSLSEARTIAELDTGKLKGDPSRMAWSPDQAEIYVQTIEGAFHQPKAVRHYIVNAKDGKIKDVKGEPDWFAAYWSVKSHKSSPDTPSLDIALSTEQRIQKTTSTPMGGDLARGGADIGTGGSAGGELNAAATSQSVTVHIMKLHGQTIGEFVNSVIVPGLTFAWAPAGAKAIAYTEPKGGELVLMDASGKRQAIDDTEDALLPMWSADAKKLAWLKKDGRRKFLLKVAEIR
jgi:hypothetical protein